MDKKRIDNIINKTKGKKINSELVIDTGFLKIFKEDYLLPDKRVITKQRISKNCDKSAAIVVTRTIEDKYLIVFQNRVDNIVSAEFPSGYIENGEDPIKGALREVKEETGYVAKDAIILDTCMSNIGTEHSKLYLIYAYNAKKESNQELDPNEYINYELFTFDELKELVDNNYIQATSNKLAFYHLKEILKNKNT